MNIRTLVYNSIGGSNRLLLVLSVLGLIAVVGFTLSSLPAWSQLLSEPQVVDDADLAAFDGSTRYNVQVNGDSMIDTGYEEYTTRNGVRTSEKPFGLLAIGSGEKSLLLLVRQDRPIDEDVTQYNGTLIIPTSISGEVLADLTKELPANMRPLLLPFMLDTVDYTSNWAIGFVALLALAGLTIWGFFLFVQRRDPLKHPFLKNLGRYGMPEMVLSAIERDMAQDYQQVHEVILTPQWVLHANPKAFRAAARLDALAWIYQQTTRTRYGTTYTVIIWDKHGTQISINAKEEQVREMLLVVAQAAPHVAIGHTSELEKRWKKQRPAFVKEVEARRLQMQMS